MMQKRYKTEVTKLSQNNPSFFAVIYIILGLLLGFVASLAIILVIYKGMIELHTQQVFFCINFLPHKSSICGIIS